MQKLLTLAITAAIIYMIFQHNISNIPRPDTDTNTKNDLNPKTGSLPAQPENPEPTGNFVEKTISSVLINVLKTEEGRMFFENILQPVNRPIAGGGQGFKINNDNLIESMFDIKTFGEGILGPTTCGHIVTVSYKILTTNNIVLTENTITYPLGSQRVAPGVDAVIVGMKTGQTRQAVISGKYTEKAQNREGNSDGFKLNVTLKEIMPRNFVGPDVKIFDDEIAYKLPLLCGNRAVYHARITKLASGEIIYDSAKGGKINMSIGNLSYPVIFSYALHNKIPIGTRTVIAKGKLFKSFVNKYSSIFPNTTLPENEFFMLELYDFENNLTPDSNRLPIQNPQN